MVAQASVVAPRLMALVVRVVASCPAMEHALEAALAPEVAHVTEVALFSVVTRVSVVALASVVAPGRTAALAPVVAERSAQQFRLRGVP